MNKTRVAVFVGSPRKVSYSRKMAEALIRLAPSSLDMEILEFTDLPFYNQDLEDAGETPASWLEFRRRVRAHDALLFVSPEYNRGVPAQLKNALDVGSRPYGKGVWSGRPGAVVTISQGVMGGFGANHSLRQSLVFLNVPCMQQPEAYIGNVGAIFDEEGRVVNDASREFMTGFMRAFASWVERHTERRSD